jgi:hypothetical protein
MALLFMESFDGYGGTASQATKWNAVGTLGTSGPAPRTGAYRAHGNWTRAMFPASATVIVNLAVYWNGSGQVNVGLSDSAGTAQTTLVLDSDGKVRLRNGLSSGTVLEATAAAVLVSGSWNALEAKILTANAGTWTVKLNGVQILSGSGDTQGAATNNVSFLSLTNATAGNGIDDLYVCDDTGSVNNDFAGDCKIECLSPQAGNGSNVGLTCSTGTDHGALVDELPANDDTDYAYSATAGAKDTYNFTDVATVGVIKAVQVSARARKTDVAPKTLAIVTRVGGVDTDGPSLAVASTTYGQYQQVLETKPGGGAWTIADINGAEFGLKVVS